MVAPTPVPFFIMVGLYLLSMAAIGIYAAKRTTNLREFFVMNAKAGAILSGLAYFSTQYSMSTFMGVPGTCYKVGYSGLAVSVPGLVFSMIIPALFVGRKLIALGKKHKFLTMADYLGDRYDSQGIRVLLALMMLFFLIPLMGAQTIGAGVIVNVFTGLPYWVGVVAMGVIVIFYCMSGGIRGAILTDAVQGTLMVGTAIVTFILSVAMGGGFSAINAKIASVSPELLTFPGKGNYMPWQNYVSQVVLWSFFTIGQPQLFTKFFAMKNYRVMFRAVLLGTLGMWFAATLIEWAGVNAIAILPNIDPKEIDRVVPMILQRGLNPFLASLFIAGIVAAGMSTIDSVLIMTTGAISRDIYQKVLNTQATDQQVMSISRIVTVIIGIIVIIFGVYRPGTIFTIILFAFGGMGLFVVPVLLGMYWKKATLPGAIVSVVAGMILMLLIQFKYKSWALGFHPLIVSALFALIVMVVVSQLTKPPAEAVLARHFD